jgi:hypothetical protein
MPFKHNQLVNATLKKRFASQSPEVNPQSYRLHAGVIKREPVSLIGSLLCQVGRVPRIPEHTINNINTPQHTDHLTHLSNTPKQNALIHRHSADAPRIALPRVQRQRAQRPRGGIRARTHRRGRRRPRRRRSASPSCSPSCTRSSSLCNSLRSLSFLLPTLELGRLVLLRTTTLRLLKEPL